MKKGKSNRVGHIDGGIKKGDFWISLFDFFVVSSYSTVTELEDTTTIPYLTFIYRYKTHEFGFVKEFTDNSLLKLHNTISKLKHQGLGYRKISKKLNEMGIKSVTGKTFYPSLVSNMWRTIKRREEKLNRELELSMYSPSLWNSVISVFWNVG